MGDIQQFLTQAQTEIEACGSTAELDAVELRYLGKKGALSALLRQIGSLPPEQRPAFGQAVNRAREQIEQWLDARRAALERAELEQRLQAERLDVTLPGTPLRPARLHPLTLTMRKVKAALMGLGFELSLIHI